MSLRLNSKSPMIAAMEKSVRVLLLLAVELAAAGESRLGLMVATAVVVVR